MAKRKAISKKTRFEVFKRDAFTCVYCGKRAPDVVETLKQMVFEARSWGEFEDRAKGMLDK
jgi:hypothetical protein